MGGWWSLGLLIMSDIDGIKNLRCSSGLEDRYDRHFDGCTTCVEWLFCVLESL